MSEVVFDNLDDIFISRSKWGKLTEEELNLYIDKVFLHYRKHGFPYYPVTKLFRMRQFYDLLRYNTAGILIDKVVAQSMHGLGLVWSYFPHAFHVKCGEMTTPFEAYSDDDMFKAVIRKRMQLGDNMSDAGLRKTLKLYSGCQGVSNFRPTAAIAIYNHFAPGGVAWDMSCGYGGRLLGAIVSNLKSYIGTDPDSRTFHGLVGLALDFADDEFCYDLQRIGSEDFKPDPESLDLCFTSPPYYDWEKYSEEETQSYIKFPVKKDWLEGFLKPTFRSCFVGLKKGKHLVINISNTKKAKDLEDETIQIAKSVGFRMVDEWKLALSNPNLKKKKDGVDFKYEPIFIFIKD